MIYIIGIGPGGDIDYLTLKAFKVIKQKVDVGIYIGEMICDDIKNLFQDKILLTGDLSKMEVIKFINDSILEDNNLAILMPGDSSFYSGQFGEQFMLHEYVDLFKRENYSFEIIPGITALNAICAKLNIDITSFSANQNVFISSIERIRDTNHYNADDFIKVFKTKPNIVLYQSFRDWNIVKELLLSAGINLSTKIIFAYKVSWGEEKIIETTLGNTELVLKNIELERHTIILILPVVNFN